MIKLIHCLKHAGFSTGHPYQCPLQNGYHSGRPSYFHTDVCSVNFRSYNEASYIDPILHLCPSGSQSRPDPQLNQGSFLDPYCGEGRVSFLRINQDA